MPGGSYCVFVDVTKVFFDDKIILESYLSKNALEFAREQVSKDGYEIEQEISRTYNFAKWTEPQNADMDDTLWPCPEEEAEIVRIRIVYSTRPASS